MCIECCEEDATDDLCACSEIEDNFETCCRIIISKITFITKFLMQIKRLLVIAVLVLATVIY